MTVVSFPAGDVLAGLLLALVGKAQMLLKDFADENPNLDLFIGRHGHPGESFDGVKETAEELHAGGLRGSVVDGEWHWDGNHEDLALTLVKKQDAVYRIKAS